MQLLALLVFVLGVALASPMLGFTRPAAAAAIEPALDRPDIVILYLDDVDPHDGRLWNDPSRTPTLARLFGDGGIEMTNAVAETPLCSPGRASLLTGRHTSSHGVDGNIAAPFDPDVTIGSELQEAGYQTMFVGKYLNGLRSEVPDHRMLDHATGWDAFDVIYEDNGQYLGYDLWTRNGMLHFGRHGANHSTLVGKRRLVEHLQAAAADQPVLAIASIFDLHAPNRPVRRYRGDRRCRSIDSWNPPSIGAEVNGKPAYVRKRRPIGKDGWPMQGYCEEMLAVDDLAAAVVREQLRRGRLDDTLFILTADNGVTWGTHRLQQRKGVPYATPIPLVFSWPARWGADARQVDELVSNIDLAPTLCAIGGCEMGPFADGAAGADGVDLWPLLDGEAHSLERTVVREQSGPRYAWAPEFWAIRTSAQHPLGEWHYIEYETGEVELYDTANDPWELDNVALDERDEGITAQLADALRLEFGDGVVPAHD